MLKSSLLFFAAALAVFMCLPLAGHNPQAAPVAAQDGAVQKNPVKPTAESQAHAKMVFARDCALCHGATGNGKTDVATSMNVTMDDWTNSATLASKSDADLFAIIRNGKNLMPAEDAGRASDTEVRNLIIYIRALPKSQPAPAAPAPVATN